MENDFMKYLVGNYDYNEPILLSEICEREDCNYSYNTLKQKFSRAVKSGELMRYEKRNGVYYVPKENSLGLKPTISSTTLINKMYIKNENEVFGYKTNLTFANDLRLTNQVPGVMEITTSKEKSKKRAVEINKMKIILRKPKVEVTNKNYKLLQILDLLNNFYSLSDKSLFEAKNEIDSYLSDVKIPLGIYNEIMKKYPERVREKSREIDLRNVIT